MSKSYGLAAYESVMRSVSFHKCYRIKNLKPLQGLPYIKHCLFAVFRGITKGY